VKLDLSRHERRALEVKQRSQPVEIVARVKQLDAIAPGCFAVPLGDGRWKMEWRRPLSEDERAALRAFAERCLVTNDGPSPSDGACLAKNTTEPHNA